MEAIKKHHQLVVAVLIVLILGGSLPYKFTGAPVTDHIFNVVGEFLGFDFFKTSGGYIIGIAELVACILVLLPSQRAFGGLLTVGIMTGAIFFHLASPLGVEVHYIDASGNPAVESQLFYMAIVAWLSGAYLAIKNKDTLPVIGTKA